MTKKSTEKSKTSTRAKKPAGSPPSRNADDHITDALPLASGPDHPKYPSPLTATQARVLSAMNSGDRLPKRTTVATLNVLRRRHLVTLRHAGNGVSSPLLAWALTPAGINALTAHKESKQKWPTDAGKITIATIRTAIADYMATEGCSCCRDSDGHAKAAETLGKLLKVKKYSDGSGRDFSHYRSKK